MKRLAIVILLAALLLTGCKPLVKDEDIPESFTIYASFYPIYALSALIIDNIPGMMLHQLVQPQDGCLRNYSLSDWDAFLLQNAADALILGGSGLESFAEAIYTLEGDGPAVVAAMSSLVLKHTDDETESHFSGVNPWLFLSVDGAEQICEAICANMTVLDEPYAAQYIQNLETACKRFDGLKADMEMEFDNCDRSQPVALMHEGLIYFADEWNLNVVTTIERESGVDAQDDELTAMLDTLEQSGAEIVLIEKQAPQALKNALIASGYRVAGIDTLSTGRENMGAQGYFDAMLNNARETSKVMNKTEK